LKVTRVYDGDSIKVVGGHSVARKVRLVGIDAPEASWEQGQPGQPYSQRAKNYLASLILNEAVFMLKYGTDTHDRVLAVVYKRGININLDMVRAGLAEVYRGIPSPGLDLNPYWQAEKDARKAKRGMWRLGDNYVSPRKWRRGRKGK
jgi:endonuclease YncB( thermonuclease family)